MGIRTSFGEKSALQTTLNLAVAQQLSVQPGIAVSERWRLNDLVFEKSLGTDDQTNFAAGSLLVDGSLETNDDHNVLRLRFRESGEQNGNVASIRIPLSAPVDLATKISAEIVKKMQSTELSSADSTAEARLFSELGKYLIDRKFVIGAIQAYETAIALGDDSADTKFGRLKSYTIAVAPETGILRLPPTHQDKRTLNLMSASDFDQIINLTIRMLRSANEISEGGWKTFPESEYKTDMRIFSLRAIFSLGQTVLESIHKRAEISRLASEAKIIRSECRQILNAIQVFHQDYYGEDIRIGYIYDTPNETISAYRKLYDPKFVFKGDNSTGLDARSLTYYAYSRNKEEDPEPVVDWTGKDPQAAKNAWRDWLNELSNSESKIS